MRKRTKKTLALVLLVFSLIAGSLLSNYRTIFANEAGNENTDVAKAVATAEGTSVSNNNNNNNNNETEQDSLKQANANEAEAAKPAEAAESKAEPVREAARMMAIPGITNRAPNSNAKIGFAVGEIENDKIVGADQEKREYWVDDIIKSAVDLDISGDGVKYENPVVRIKVKKTDIITAPDFAASQNAFSSKPVEDGEYYVFEHSFKTLTGGQHLTFPLPFKFDPYKNMHNGDEAVVSAEFFTRADGVETMIKTAKKIYVAKVADIKTHLLMADNGSYDYKYEDEEHETPVHYRKVPVNPNDADKTRMSKGTFLEYHILPFEYIGIPDDVKGRKGYIYPNDITFKITFSDDILKSGIGYQNDKRTLLVKTVGAKWTDSYKGKPAWYSNVYFKIENAKLKEKIPYTVDYYINYGREDQRQITPSRTGYIYLNPIPFTIGGTFSISNEGYAHTSNDNKYYVDVPYSTWSRDSYKYSYMNGDLFYRSNNIKDVGMLSRYDFSNGNNGGAAGQTGGGRISKVKELEVEFLNDGEYFKALNLAALDENIKTQIDGTGNKVYGITPEGNKVQLASDIKFRELVKINDNTRKYSKLRVVFDSPIKLDNQTLTLVTYTHLTKKELDKYENKEYKGVQYYRTHATAQVQSGQEPFASESYVTANSSDDYGFHKVEAVQPLVNEYREPNKMVTYRQDGTPITHTVGPYVDGNNDYSNWGDIKQVSKIKTVTFLPTGIIYEGNNKNKEVQVIENYKNTGKTAVIVDYDDLVITDGNYESNLIQLNLKATKDTKRGENIVETYLLYDQNDVIKPYSNDVTVADKLDLDGDGNKDENFMVVKSIIEYVPAYELILHKDIRDLDGHIDTATNNLDLNDKIDYVVSLFNNSLVPVTRASVIDKLPFVGDKSIVPNDQGINEDRGSTYEVRLRDFVENLDENKTILEDFDVYYQLTSANTLEGIRDGRWLTKSEMTKGDISKVRNLKFVLKDGKNIGVKKEARFIIPAIMPNDKSLDKETATSVNTSAFSTDATGYNEGNNARASFSTYAVNGKVYEDKNENGIFDAGDVALKKVKVELLDSDGNVAKSIDKKELKTETDADGNYHFDVYSRGKYTVRVINPSKYFEFNTDKKQPEDVKTKAGNSIGDEAQAESGKSSEFTLNPETPESIQNSALFRRSFNINVSKLWTEGSKAQEKAYFVLEMEDEGTWKAFDTDKMSLGDKTYEISKNDQGKFELSLEISNTFKDKEFRIFETDVSGKKAVEADGKTKLELNKIKYDVEIAGNKATGFTITNEQKYRLDYVVIPDKTYGVPTDSVVPDSKTEIKYNSKETLSPQLKTRDTKANNTKGKWTFTGWSKNKADIESNIEKQLNITGDTTVYGKWEFNPHKDIKVSKQWKNYNGKSIAESDKAEIKVQLYKNGEAIEKPLPLNAANKWTATFEDLEIATKAGETPHKYEVKEVGTDADNDIKIKSNWFKSSVATDNDGNFVVTNTKHLTFTPMIIPTRNVSVVKHWLNDKGRDLPESKVKDNEISVQLYRVDDETETKVGEAVTLNQRNNFSHSFDKLPVSDELGGKSIKYIVKEEGVKDGQITLNDLTYTSETRGDMKEGFTITNTLINPDKKIAGEKIWDDADNQDGIRPETVNIHLIAGGEDTGKSVEIGKADDWKYEFDNLKTYDDNGDAINYEVTEDKVEGYKTKIEDTKITNTHEPEAISLKISKKWIGTEAKKITVRVFADDKEVKKLDVTARDGWMASVDKLPKFKDGKEIKYTVKEDKLEGYDSKLSGDMKDGFVIMNREQKKPVNTGDRNNIAMYISLILTSALMMAAIIKRKMNDR